MKKSLLTIWILFFAITPAVSSAYDFTEIINNVVNSVSTGGNRAGSGEVIEGVAEANVKVYTEINGEVIEDIDESFISDTGEIEVKVESKIEVDSQNQIKSESQIEVSEKTEPIITPQVEMPRVPLDIKPEVGLWAKVREIIKNVFKIFKF